MRVKFYRFQCTTPTTIIEASVYSKSTTYEDTACMAQISSAYSCVLELGGYKVLVKNLEMRCFSHIYDMQFRTEK